MLSRARVSTEREIEIRRPQARCYIGGSVLEGDGISQSKVRVKVRVNSASERGKSGLFSPGIQR
jgi:hypothetical protein